MSSSSCLVWPLSRWVTAGGGGHCVHDVQDGCVACALVGCVNTFIHACMQCHACVQRWAPPVDQGACTVHFLVYALDSDM